MDISFPEIEKFDRLPPAKVDGPEKGDVLVVTNTAPSSHGMFGELIATSLMARGTRALIMDAGVRDTAELRELGFAVYPH